MEKCTEAIFQISTLYEDNYENRVNKVSTIIGIKMVQIHFLQ